MMKARERKAARINYLLEGLLRPLWQYSCWLYYGKLTLGIPHQGVVEALTLELLFFPITSSSCPALLLSSCISLAFSLSWLFYPSDYYVDMLVLEIQLPLENIMVVPSSCLSLQHPEGSSHRSAPDWVGNCLHKRMPGVQKSVMTSTSSSNTSLRNVY